ncbi:helix-turn-helix transcriptional regulator [Pseudodesulfovibrio tunisiensis]|uniref:helix-turn-helix transcriptional regulator n=1 Tax=Pseudodesulfovibrio tunisiensis TaxID=463192 RepID=UPI001FB3CF70|nr:AlpA family phage regulatory protein [Pseudodesulfovibrio tunisiensis]
MEAKQDLGPGLNWKQAIKRLGCSKSMFYYLVENGAFPNAYRLGRNKGVRVPLADIDAFRGQKRLA